MKYLNLLLSVLLFLTVDIQSHGQNQTLSILPSIKATNGETLGLSAVVDLLVLWAASEDPMSTISWSNWW